MKDNTRRRPQLNPTRIAKDLEISRDTVYKVKQLISRTPKLE
jgi:hypothetical protein